MPPFSGSPARKTLEKLKRALAQRGVIVYSHASASRKERMCFINSVKAERELLLTHVEAEQLINALGATQDIPGEIAEVGTYRGASARLLRNYAAPGKVLHVFDTFSGLPEPGSDDAKFNRGEFACSLEEVQRYLGHNGIKYHVGMFPSRSTTKCGA